MVNSSGQHTEPHWLTPGYQVSPSQNGHIQTLNAHKKRAPDVFK